MGVIYYQKYYHTQYEEMLPYEFLIVDNLVHETIQYMQQWYSSPVVITVACLIKLSYNKSFMADGGLSAWSLHIFLMGLY